MRAEKLKALEDAVAESVQRLRRLAEDNGKLKTQAQRLEEENGRLELELRRTKAAFERQGRLRGKLERLVQKLERAMEDGR